jgi:glutamyl-tRNA reductase
MVIQLGENNFNLINARVTFKNVPLHKLEQFAFKDITAAYEAFKKITDVSECVILQNAFRIEVFMAINLEKGEIPDLRRAEGKGLTINQIKETWQSLTELEQIEIDHFDQTFEVFKNTEVYSSLLRLASGLNSIVVGREEILDEIKKSFSTAKQANDSGPVLNKLFDNTIRTATRIRNSTEISKGIVSLGEIAIKTVEDKVGLDEKKNVLLMGTGEIAAMVAQSLNKKDKKFSVTSLTIERATGFSQILGGTPIKIEDVFSGFDKFDIVFVATTSDYLLVNYNKIRRVMENKKKGTFILDISNPRAVDEKISTLPGIKLMFRDQIDEMFQEFVKASRAKVPAVENLIGKEAPILEATMK